MAKIINDDMHSEKLLGYLEGLCYLAMKKTKSQGKEFKREDYKWVLGAKIISELEANHSYQNSLYHKLDTFLGIVVEADWANPNNIQLWENITNKL